jgi:hypothetical protein
VDGNAGTVHLPYRSLCSLPITNARTLRPG